MSKLKWDKGMNLVPVLSKEFAEFHAEERGVSGNNALKISSREEVLFESPNGGNVRLCREDGKAYLYWGKVKDHVDMGWAVGYLGRIAGKSDEEAYDILRLERELRKIKVIKKDVNSW